MISYNCLISVLHEILSSFIKIIWDFSEHANNDRKTVQIKGSFLILTCSLPKKKKKNALAYTFSLTYTSKIGYSEIHLMSVWILVSSIGLSFLFFEKDGCAGGLTNISMEVNLARYIQTSA